DDTECPGTHTMPRRVSPLCLVLAAAAAAGLAVRAASTTAPAPPAPAGAAAARRDAAPAGPLDALFGVDAEPASAPAPLFSEAGRGALVAYWNAPGRYRSGLPPEAVQKGPWQVRLTPDGSRWFLAYQRALGAGRLPPSVDAVGGGGAAAWEK